MGSDLQTVLARYPAGFRPSSEPEPLGNAGGLSGSRLWRFAAGARTLVARAWPVDGPPRPVLERTHLWLVEAERLGFVPTPIPSSDGRTIVEEGGRLWELSSWMDGSADLGSPPKRAHVRSGFAGLAAFHGALARYRTEGVSPGIAGRLGEVQAWQAQGFTRLERILDDTPPDPANRSARRWLKLARKVAPRVRAQLVEGSRIEEGLQPCLRDARPDHFLFKGDRLTGLVDFGAMGIDSVAADLARLMSEWLGDDRIERDSAMDAYSKIRPLQARELALIPIFEASSALLSGGRWASWRFLEGKVFDDPDAVIRGLQKGADRLASWSARDL
jgi:Ser/Thr protein kinase RdoA (MazF antagonist)